MDAEIEDFSNDAEIVEEPKKNWRRLCTTYGQRCTYNSAGRCVNCDGHRSGTRAIASDREIFERAMNDGEGRIQANDVRSDENHTVRLGVRI